MKITLCVSVPNNGEKLLALLTASAALLQSGDHDVVLHFTCHNEEQQESLTRIASSAMAVEKSHIVIAEQRSATFMHAPSVTHSRCINALFRGSDGDISVICDYDAAFVMRDWDSIFVEQILDHGLAFFGAPYSSGYGADMKLPIGIVHTRKYQGKPNCILIGFETGRIKKLSDRICDFETQFGAPEELPFKLISNHRESRQFGLPIGRFAHIDTGTLVTELIQAHDLPFATLDRRDSGYRTINVPEGIMQQQQNIRPEEYYLNGEPFFTHFRKGSIKQDESATPGGYTISEFANDIEAYIRVNF